MDVVTMAGTAREMRFIEPKDSGMGIEERSDCLSVDVKSARNSPVSSAP